MGKVVVGTVLLLSVLLFAQFVGLAPEDNRREDERQFAQKADLALRRTAHHLLLEKGDSTTRIAPVRHVNKTTYSIQLEESFDYDRIPGLLQESLTLHHISTGYNVAVLDCEKGELQLGYNIIDFTKAGEVPCTGRQQVGGCHQLQVTFAAPSPEPTLPAAGIWWSGALGFLLASVGGLVWYRSTRTEGPVTAPSSSDKQRPACIQMGQTLFSPAEQSLELAGTRQSLTYRESKLLHLFATHPNQLLERDFILKSVWEDEGITVGRSVDVFVSRLRKLLLADSSLRLVAVHGVGYRLEVRPEEEA
ncbi:winged helix-turn-helix domain-containing protein [Telluribacter humicola]|uniref:winged helix-turn-helix domain-containing protein n=1 Tax=Telluribacter humicola TaxID=1720261 RepID=UPI001A96C56F|nr:winged helix-turn-helix domain-containing protein [Telluribacter humicola]